MSSDPTDKLPGTVHTAMPAATQRTSAVDERAQVSTATKSGNHIVAGAVNHQQVWESATRCPATTSRQSLSGRVVKRLTPRREAMAIAGIGSALVGVLAGITVLPVVGPMPLIVALFYSGCVYAALHLYGADGRRGQAVAQAQSKPVDTRWQDCRNAARELLVELSINPDDEETVDPLASQLVESVHQYLPPESGASEKERAYDVKDRVSRALLESRPNYTAPLRSSATKKCMAIAALPVDTQAT